MELTKYFVYLVIILKSLFFVVYVYYNILDYSGYNKEKLKSTDIKKEILHKSFLFCSYILMILLFNPYNAVVYLDKNKSQSEKLKVILFAVAILQLWSFDYSIIYKIPIALDFLQ